MVAEAQQTAESDPVADLIHQGAYREAITMCARLHGAALGRLCMAMLGSQAEAEETVQEALLAAHDAFGEFRAEGSVRAWLFGIARRMCARRLVKRVRRERRLKLVHDAESDHQLPDEQIELERRARLVRAALETLKPSEREIVVLRYQSGLSYREIAELCGVEEAAARKRVSRALVHLRTTLRDEVEHV